MQQQSDNQPNWRENAIQFLIKNTHALQDFIEHFVSLYWQHDATDDENLENFETYHAEYQQTFAY